MAPSPSLESLIELTSRFKDELGRLLEAYGKVPTVIRKEHAFLEAGLPGRVEETAEEKLELGQNIADCVKSMGELGERIRVFRSEYGEEIPSDRNVVTLSDCVAALGDIEARIDGESLSGQVFSHLLIGLKNMQSQFSELYAQVKPLIDSNKLVLELMRESYSESYLFWRQIEDEVRSSYNAKGEKASLASGRGFRAKA